MTVEIWPANEIPDEVKPVTLETVARQIKNMQPRTHAPGELEDVFVLIEWMQASLVQRHEALEAQAAALLLREQNVTKREREVALRSRAADVLTTLRPARNGPINRLAKLINM